MTKTATLTPVYILVSFDQFIGNDSSSGGYPYATRTIRDAFSRNDPISLLEWFGKTGKEMFPHAYVAKLEFTITRVSVEELDSAAREKALAKLTPEERRVLGL